MKRITTSLLCAAMLAACSNHPKDAAQQADSINMTKDSAQKTHPLTWGQEISGDDAKFAVEAAAGGLAEVELGKLAQQKGSTPEVKAFGAMMVKDHSAANAELSSIAKSKRIVLPHQLAGDGLELQKELSAKSGHDFDLAYAKAMVKDHEEDTTAFARGIKVVKYPEILAFAKKTLPVLKMHLAAAQKLDNSLSK